MWVFHFLINVSMTSSQLRKNIFQFLFLGITLFTSKYWVLWFRKYFILMYSTLSKRLALWVSQTTYFNQINQWKISSHAVLQVFEVGQANTGFGQSCGDVWHAFIPGWGNPHGQAGSPDSLPYMLSEHKASGRASSWPSGYITELNSVHAGPCSRLCEYCWVIVAQTSEGVWLTPLSLHTQWFKIR